MIPRITTWDLSNAHEQSQAEDAERRLLNRLYCQRLDNLDTSKAWEDWVQAHHATIKLGE